jgi:Zn-dependent protease
MLSFFRRQIEVARVFGIPIRVDYRWFLVFALMIWLTATNIPETLVRNEAVKWLLALVTTLAFFLSIFGHELAHAFAARMENIETLEIVLHPFGGLARLKHEPDNPRAEFRIAIAGPAASFLIGIAFLVGMAITYALDFRVAPALLFLLFFGNILLAVFNLFPGYPLDGGRVLRAFLWHRGYDLGEATKLTGRCGQVIAIALVIFGLFITFLRGDLFTGVWTILVGIFLLDAANGVVGFRFGKNRLTVGEVMSQPVSIQPETAISQFVDHTLPIYRQTSFLVARDNRLHGVLTLEDLRKLPRERWYQTTVRQIMRPVDQNFFVSSTVKLNEADELMSKNGIGALAVIDNQGLLVGFLQRGKIRRKS